MKARMLSYPVFALLLSQLALHAADKGFVDLYNKKDLTGWSCHNGKIDAWKAEAELLVCNGQGGGWLRTEKDDYANFIIKLDWKIPPHGNSGVGLRCPPTGDPAHEGMEIQILDDDAPEYKGKLDPGQYTGGIYYQVPSDTEKREKALKPPGEWNSYEITCKGPLVIVVLNGVEITRGNMDEQKVGRGGHKALNDRPRKGFLALQSHGSRVEFKNIGVKVLD